MATWGTMLETCPRRLNRKFPVPEFQVQLAELNRDPSEPGLTYLEL